MNVNDRVLPAPGSFVCTVCQADDNTKIFMVIASRQDKYPGPWTQYEMTLLRADRVLHLSTEQTDFHNDWHVLHRP